MPKALATGTPIAAKMKQTSLGDFWRKVKGSRVGKPKAPSKKLVDASHTRMQQQSTPQSGAEPMLLDDEDETTGALRGPLNVLDDDETMEAVHNLPNVLDDGPVSVKSDLNHPELFGSGDETVSTTRTMRTLSEALGKKASKTGPILHDSGEEIVGEGIHQAAVSILTLQEDSSAFFGGTNKKVAKSKEAAEKYRLEAEDYAVVESSTVVKTRDGVPLLYFLKDGMLAGLTPEERQHLPIQSLSAIRGLVKAYPPPAPPKKDSRVIQQQRDKQLAKKQAYGRYYLCYWKLQANPYGLNHVSSAAQPKAASAMRKLKDYLDATSWEHVQVTRWISALDSNVYKELHDCYQSFGPENMKHLYQGPEACHSGLALLVNVAVDPHKDSNDAEDSWTTTNVWEVFEGGVASFCELGINIAQKPGDLILCHAAVLTHMVGAITAGERFCHVRFTKKDVLRPPADKEIPCPVPDCAKICVSEGALRKHLRGPTKAERRARGEGTYHWFDASKTKKVVRQAIQAWEIAMKVGLDSRTGNSGDEEKEGGDYDDDDDDDDDDSKNAEEDGREV